MFVSAHKVSLSVQHALCSEKQQIETGLLDYITHL